MSYQHLGFQKQRTQLPSECSFDELQQAEKEPTPRMSKQNLPEVLFGDLGPVQFRYIASDLCQHCRPWFQA
jgi:hypothetical protein